MLLQRQQTLESAVPVGKNEGPALRGASRAARVTQARKTSKIGSKIDLKSSKLASRGRSEALVGRLFGVRMCMACEIELRAGSNGVRAQAAGELERRAGSDGGRLGRADQAAPQRNAKAPEQTFAQKHYN